MRELINVMNKEGQLVVSSRDIARDFEKRHDHVLRDLDKILKEQKETFQFDIVSSKYKNRGKLYREYLLSERGIQIYLANSRIEYDKVKDMGFYSKYINTIIIKNRFENEFKKQLIETLRAMNIEVETQKKVDKYKIDFYIPHYKLAIEYDEEQHKYQQKEDKLREEYINKILGCEFVRLNYKNSDAHNVGVVVNKIMKGMVV